MSNLESKIQRMKLAVLHKRKQIADTHRIRRRSEGYQRTLLEQEISYMTADLRLLKEDLAKATEELRRQEDNTRLHKQHQETRKRLHDTSNTWSRRHGSHSG